MWAKEKFSSFIFTKKINIFFFINILYFFSIISSEANFQEEFISKYSTINTLSFDFTQKIGKKIEFGNCQIKYPLLINCYYPKKNKNIISNGKKLAIVKKRYKKVYYYPLKKTPLFYLLKKENILNLIKNNQPLKKDGNIIEYEITDNNLNKFNIFFDTNKIDLLGWKTTDSYSNEVSFLIRNIKKNILIKNKIFKIPREEDL